MKVLFVHQNFPGQFGALATHLAKDPKNTVVALRLEARAMPIIKGVKVVPYSLLNQPLENQHLLLVEQESKLLRAEAAASKALELKDQGFTPDIIIAHTGWGEALFLKDVWPTTKLVCYAEYFYRAEGQDADFDPEFSTRDQIHQRLLRWKNAANYLSLEQADVAVSPTNWQKNTFPEVYREKIHVIHDGIDTEYFKPDPKASLTLAKSKKILTSKNEVITFVARYLEPIRGFHTFMRALPAILDQRPKAEVLILGGSDLGYMSPPSGFPSYKHMLLSELHKKLDVSRVHFLGVQGSAAYRSALQISTAHVYLTYPFVLSWSLLEAMSCGVRLFASNTQPVLEFVIDGENGTLFNFDSDSLAKSVSQSLNKTRKGNAMRKNARDSILPIDRSKMLSTWSELLKLYA